MGLLRSLLRSSSRKKHKTRTMSVEKKGAVGEKLVNSKLNPKIFGEVEHKQINNLTIMDESGKSLSDKIYNQLTTIGGLFSKIAHSWAYRRKYSSND